MILASLTRKSSGHKLAREEFLDSQDVKLDLLHDRNTTIARSNKGVGNLRLFAKSTQVDFEADIPKCDIGDRALALVKSGVYTGCSFEFFGAMISML